MADAASEVRQAIRTLLAKLVDDASFVDRVSDTESLRRAGVSSTALVSLLVAMEDEFGFEWEDDVEPEVLRSIGSLADHVVAVRG
ncbi:phosphopantetheine-binding protein [Saccharomonospora sp. NB11]|jgi:acyl carrier protein|uniref:phosphopantetheine-binding protein n=1 Tax=Saccharomonospora sp. NB11 TaxID=1642298 RepID=UPI0018D091E3|nr:phosphopantetheine-binding protein [Saccharomonospora sp. NB11]